MADNINAELAEQLRNSISEGLSETAMERARKQVRDLAAELETDLQYAMVERMSDYLTGYVEEMAKRTVESILQGDEQQMRRYLSCDVHGYTGRSDWTGAKWFAPRKIDEAHPVIHGRLHEHSQLALRRDLVNAHRDLIASERIKDLEDQVKSLVVQVNKANEEKEAMWLRLQAAS